MFNSAERLERIRDFVKCQKTINNVQRQMGNSTYYYTDLVYRDIEWACSEIEELRNEIARANSYIEDNHNFVTVKKFKNKIL
jgi:hypothetical protein